MLMGEFFSLAQLGLPVKVIVLNSRSLGFVELEQEPNAFLDVDTEFKSPNFAAMAEAVGIRGFRLEDPSDVQEEIAAALSHDGPALIDVVANWQELTMPPAVSVTMEKGSSDSMAEAVLSGRASEIVALARTYL
jgi:pyruvate dehydrogenase (quinone)